MDQKLYSVLKSVALIWLPALGTMVFAVTDLWNLSYGAQIVGTIMAVDTFLGAGLKLNPRKFDGDLVLDTSAPVKDVFTIDVGNGLLDAENKKEIRLKVVKKPNDLVAKYDDPRL